MRTHRTLRLFGMVIVTLGVGVGGALPAAAQSTGQLFVLVTDQNGQPVTGIAPEQFRVEEDGLALTVVAAQPGATPMKVALLVDNSEMIRETNGLTSLRNSLVGFLDAFPTQHEVGLFTIGGSVRRRVDFTTDREELRDSAEGIFAAGGGAEMIEGLLETWDRRFEEDDAWPVFVLVLTDGPETSRNVQVQEFNDFVASLVSRAATVHVVMLSTRGGNIQTQFSRNLTQNTGGLYRSIVVPTALEDVLTEVATRMGTHFDEMSGRYRLLFERPGDTPGAALAATVVGAGLTMRLFADRRMPPE